MLKVTSADVLRFDERVVGVEDKNGVILAVDGLDSRLLRLLRNICLEHAWDHLSRRALQLGKEVMVFLFIVQLGLSTVLVKSSTSV